MTVNAKDGRVEASSIQSTIAVGCWSENCWDLYPQTWRYEIFIEGSKKNMFIGSRLNDLGENITSQRGQRASN